MSTPFYTARCFSLQDLGGQDAMDELAQIMAEDESLWNDETEEEPCA